MLVRQRLPPPILERYTLLVTVTQRSSIVHGAIRLRLWQRRTRSFFQRDRKPLIMAMKAAQGANLNRRLRMKRFFKEFSIVFCTAAIIYILVINLFAYLETRDCPCSVLSYQEETYPIDEKLDRIVSRDSLNSGTFLLVTTTCDHGVHMQLTIYNDNGTYRGRRMSD